MYNRGFRGLQAPLCRFSWKIGAMDDKVRANQTPGRLDPAYLSAVATFSEGKAISLSAMLMALAFSAEVMSAWTETI